MKLKVMCFALTSFLTLSIIADGIAQRKRTNDIGSTLTKADIEDIQYPPRSVAEVIASTLPKQTWGGGLGAGFQNDFEDTSICIRGEYLNRVSVINDNSGLYAGADLKYEFSNISDFKTNVFDVGGKLQIHSPITSTGQTQWVNGIRGDYFFGSRKFDDMKDDLTGFSIGYYTGLNVQVCEDFFVGLETNVLTFENQKFESEAGDEFEVDNTTLNVNKGNRVNLGVRFTF